MIWHWAIFFSALPLTACAATVSGSVVLKDTEIASVKKSGDFSGVVVYFSGTPSVAPADAPHARMLQKNKTFLPHILAIQTGTVVDFPNEDPVFHNAFSNFSGKRFDIGLYPPGTSQSVHFNRPGVVRIFCNIHPTMSAVVLVLNTPYFAVTGSDGKFSLDIPPGEYTMRVFHERATEHTLDSLTRAITVGDAPIRLGTILISESGYLPGPHKNKYGKDYPEAPNDGSYSSGVPK
jgi:plastocyanin